MLSDRQSAYASMDGSLDEALAREFALGAESLASGEALRGATAFARGHGRHGRFG
jgi:hypothetical protein